MSDIKAAKKNQYQQVRQSEAYAPRQVASTTPTTTSFPAASDGSDECGSCPSTAGMCSRWTCCPRSLHDCWSSYLACLGSCFDCRRFQSDSVEVLKLPLTAEGVPLHIHYLWLVFILLTSITAFQVSPLHGCFALILTGPVLFTTVVIHEMGHAAAALRLGGQVQRILLWPLGGLAFISFVDENSPKADAIVAIAGPLTHIPQVMVWGLLMYLTTGQVASSWDLGWGWNFWRAMCAGAIAIQFTLFFFNLIPAYPLDGGRLFRALLLHMKFDKHVTCLVVAGVGSLFGWSFVFSGFKPSSGSIFSGWNEVAIGIFILANCWQLWTMGSVGMAAQAQSSRAAGGAGGDSRGGGPAPESTPFRYYGNAERERSYGGMEEGKGHVLGSN